MTFASHRIQSSSIFIVLFQYYSILHVILSNTHFNILLHIGEYWFQYYLILPEQLRLGVDSGCDDPGSRGFQ